MTDRGRGVLPVINRKGDAMERLRSGCKINIFLRLLGRRPDGYHELFSLFLPLNAPFDEMIIRDGRKEGIHLSCDVPGIDAGNNTVTKAWRLYGEASGFAPALEVRLVKGVPHGAGLGGGSADAAGYDLYACPADGQCVTIAPHATAMIGTGLALAIPAGYFGGVFARSGLASKQGLRPANCVGVIDADYRGECTVALHNDTEEPRTVAPGDRIAQLVILPFLAAEFAEADALDETDRGAGGFGSTGR